MEKSVTEKTQIKKLPTKKKSVVESLSKEEMLKIE